MQDRSGKAEGKFIEPLFRGTFEIFIVHGILHFATRVPKFFLLAAIEFIETNHDVNDRVRSLISLDDKRVVPKKAFVIENTDLPAP